MAFKSDANKTERQLGSYGFTSCSLLIFFFPMKTKMNAGPSQASVKMDAVLTSLEATDVSAMKDSSQVPQALNALVSEYSTSMMSSQNCSSHLSLSVEQTWYETSTPRPSPHRYTSIKMMYLYAYAFHSHVV